MEKENFVQVYSHVHPDTGEMFDTPIPYTKDPAYAKWVLTARPKGEGFNFNISKAHAMIMMAKQLILFKYLRDRGYGVSSWRKHLGHLNLVAEFKSKSLCPCPHGYFMMWTGQQNYFLAHMMKIS